VGLLLRALAAAAGALAAWVPLRAALAAGRAAGRFVYSILRIRRREVEARLAAILGPDAPPARAVYEHLGMCLVELLRLRSRAQLEGWVRRAGGEHFEAAAARGRGVIVLTAHAGNWDLLAVSEALAGRVGARDVSLAIVTRHQRARGVDAVWKAKRARLGVTQIGAGGPRSARALLGHLRAGGVVGFVLDQHAGDAGVVVPFFGRPASTDPGLAALALASGAPVVPVFVRRLDDGSHLVQIEPEVPLAPGPTRAARIAASTALFAAMVERAIRRAPAQWLWLHRRWKVSGDPGVGPQRTPAAAALHDRRTEAPAA